jgi:hypothetical protein
MTQQQPAKASTQLLREEGRKQLVHPIADAKRSGGAAAPPSRESGANAKEK